MPKVKIVEVKPAGDKATVAKVAGTDKEIKWWNDSPFAPEIVVGAELDIKTEDKPSYRDKSVMEKWVTEVNGTPAKAARSGGGGRPAAPPRDEDIIVAQVILKEACETGRTNAQARGEQLAMTEVGIIADGLVEIYQMVYRALKDGAK